MNIEKGQMFYGEGREYGVPFTGNSRIVERQSGNMFSGFGGTETITQWEYQVPDGVYPDGDPRPGYLGWASESEILLEPWQLESDMKFAFISRHTPTDGQVQLAADQGIDLVHVGDADAFTVGPAFVDDNGDFDGVVVVHPAAALRLSGSFVVGVFENANRAPEGEKPSFEAVALHLYDLRN